MTSLIGFLLDWLLSLEDISFINHKILFSSHPVEHLPLASFSRIQKKIKEKLYTP